MKKLTLTCFLLIVSISLLQGGTIANVIAHKDLLLTIDRGSSDGVESGMKGIVKAVYKEPSGEYTINIGIFTVKKTLARTAEVLIEIGKGLNPDDARYVVFDQDLVPREAKAEAKPDVKPESAAPAKPSENIDWHLELGDNEAEAGNIKAALTHYQKALALAPGSLVAKEKCNEMQKRLELNERRDKFNDYMKKADANYEKNDVKFSFLYLIEGLRVFPEGQAEVKERLTVLAQEHPQEIETILAEKTKDLKDVRQQIDAMLEKITAAKAVPPAGKPAASVTGDQDRKYVEPFLQKIKAKADRIAKNEQGFWEAIFMKTIRMIYIPEGEFTIGSPARDGDDDEHPAHKVFLSGYWLGRTEVSFEQYDAFCQETGREKPDDEGWGRGERPVIYVSWHDASDFCAWLQKKTGLPFRLPSEAEWEKAARDRYPWGSAAPAAHLANFNKEMMKTNVVGSYPEGASPYGVMDMAGNVWEWLADWYSPDYYGNSESADPRGPRNGEERSVRGGSWSNNAELIRSANRSQEDPESRLNIIGFRLALSGDFRPDVVMQEKAVPTKAVVTAGKPSVTGDQDRKHIEPFLQKIKAKADRIAKNEQGFWEAIFMKTIRMIYIPEGEFTIGSPARDGDDDEHPAHKVFISGYWIGRTEVSFEQYDAFCQETGREKPDDEGWGRGERPVIYVSWHDASDFCAWLQKKTGLPFRLPSEAEWEKAARDRYPWGSAAPAAHLANFNKEMMKTNVVGSYPEGASPYGVMDMAGNVWEWLADWYSPDYYGNSESADPRGPRSGEERSVRGGSWSNNAELIRSANRSQEDPESRLNIIGFRLALSGQ